MSLNDGHMCALVRMDTLIDVARVPGWKSGRKMLLGKDLWEHCVAFGVEN